MSKIKSKKRGIGCKPCYDRTKQQARLVIAGVLIALDVIADYYQAIMYPDSLMGVVWADLYYSPASLILIALVLAATLGTITGLFIYLRKATEKCSCAKFRTPVKEYAHAVNG